MKGDLNLARCTGLTSLPDGLTVGGNLDLTDTGITRVPASAWIAGIVRGPGVA